MSFGSPLDGEAVRVTARIDGPRSVDVVTDPVIDEPWSTGTPLVVTRLHYRHRGGDAADLLLAPADPITGGTYSWARGSEGPWLVRAARPHDHNDFETRYFVGHPWEQHISCGDAAVRGAWEPRSPTVPLVEPATVTAPLALEDAFVEEVPELELTPAVPATFEPTEEVPTALAPVGNGPQPEHACGCRAVGAGHNTGAWLGLLLLALVGVRRRHPA